MLYFEILGWNAALREPNGRKYYTDLASIFISVTLVSGEQISSILCNDNDTTP